MSRTSPVIPQYRKHPNGQAFIHHKSIRTRSRRLYLGVYGSPESLERYHQACRRIAIDEDAQAPAQVGSVPQVRELEQAYDDYAKVHYMRPEGLSSEYENMWGALRVLHSLYASALAVDFGPKCLKTIQRGMAKDGYARSHINHTASRIKRFFRWCCEEELIDPAVYQKLVCVRGLARGEFGVQEAPPVRPATSEAIYAVLPFLSPTVAALVQVQYLCGMRPGEACRMRPCDIDRSGAVWLCRPPRHKNQWRGHSLTKAIPASAQAILIPLLQGRGEEEFIFDPRDAQQWAREQQLANRPPRTTKRFPSEARRVELEKQRQRKRVKKRPSRGFYNKDSYNQALQYGFAKAKAAGVEIEPFAPNQLRHAIVTLISRTQGQQKAQRYAGHKNLNTTRLYDEAQEIELIEIANQFDTAAS